MSTEDLRHFVMRATTAYRKQDEQVEQEKSGQGWVITIHHDQKVPDDREGMVDVHFFWVGFTDAADAEMDAQGFLDLIAESTEGPWENVSIDYLAKGLSFTTLGRWLDSQEAALRFIALGKHYGLWEALTPGLFFITGDAADELAGSGFVMNGGIDEASLEAWRAVNA